MGSDYTLKRNSTEFRQMPTSEFSRYTELQVAAHPVRSARVGVRMRGVAPEVGKGGMQCGEPGDLLLDLGQACVEEIAHVLAGRVTTVSDVEDLADLGEAEAGGLPSVDEVDPGDGVGRVVAVARRGAHGRGQQALLLVEPQRLRRRARSLGEFPDARGLRRSTAWTRRGT